MLNVNPEIVCRIIDLAREFHTQDAVSFPEPPEGPGTDWAVQLLSSHEEDLTYQAFEALVEDLEPDQQQEIVALLWLGREDFALDEWEVERRGPARGQDHPPGPIGPFPRRFAATMHG